MNSFGFEARISLYDRLTPKYMV